MFMVDLRLSLGEQVHPTSGSVPSGLHSAGLLLAHDRLGRPPTRLVGRADDAIVHCRGTVDLVLRWVPLRVTFWNINVEPMVVSESSHCSVGIKNDADNDWGCSNRAK